jgi:hypothetical protein
MGRSLGARKNGMELKYRALWIVVSQLSFQIGRDNTYRCIRELGRDMGRDVW